MKGLNFDATIFFAQCIKVAKVSMKLGSLDIFLTMQNTLSPPPPYRGRSTPRAQIRLKSSKMSTTILDLSKFESLRSLSDVAKNAQNTPENTLKPPVGGEGVT